MKAKVISALIGIVIGLPLALIATKQQEARWEQFKQVQNPIIKNEYVISLDESVNVPGLSSASDEAPIVLVEEVKAKATKHFDVPIDADLQEHIIEVCKEYHFAPEIVIAMIEKESTYSANSIGDDGCSVGLLQVQEKWHKDRMEKLGVTDLLDPYENVLVAVDYLAELASRNEDIMWILMAYNGGSAYADRHMDSPTEYALYITERAMELEHGN